MDERIIREIMKRAAVAQNRDFRTAVYVPPLARDRKKSIDTLLLTYKKINGDFRYLIRNGPTDLKVMVKRASELTHMPYPEIDVQILGDISPLKTRSTKPDEDKPDEEEDEIDEQGFIKPRVRKSTLWKAKITEKNQIFRNITSFSDGLSPKKKN